MTNEDMLTALLSQARAEGAELVAHGRVDAGVAAGHAVARLAGQGRMPMESFQVKGPLTTQKDHHLLQLPLSATWELSLLPVDYQ